MFIRLATGLQPNLICSLFFKRWRGQTWKCILDVTTSKKKMILNGHQQGTKILYKKLFCLILRCDLGQWPTLFAMMPLLCGKILMHNYRCSVSFLVNIFAPASKGYVIFILKVKICWCKLILCLKWHIKILLIFHSSCNIVKLVS